MKLHCVCSGDGHIAFICDLSSDQLQLLRELDFYGGVMIVRSRRNYADYEALEKAGFVTGFAVSMSELRYKITKAGKEILEGML